MVLDIEEPQPALLAKRQTDHAAEFDKLRFIEMPVHAIPKSVVGVEMPGDCLGIGERRFLPLVVFFRFFEIQEVEDVILDQRAGGGAFIERWLPQYSQVTERET